MKSENGSRKAVSQSGKPGQRSVIHRGSGVWGLSSLSLLGPPDCFMHPLSLSLPALSYQGLRAFLGQEGKLDSVATMHTIGLQACSMCSYACVLCACEGGGSEISLASEHRSSMWSIPTPQGRRQGLSHINSSIVQVAGRVSSVKFLISEVKMKLQTLVRPGR